MRPVPQQRLSPLQIDVQTQSPLWDAQPLAAQTVREAIGAAASALSTAGGEVSIVLTNDSAIRVLNRDWRGIDKATNVLSFPALQPTGARKPGDAPRMLGDIAIAYQTMRREADEEQKPFNHHLSHLAVHGFLHLIGYDHDNDADAEAMEKLEVEILAQLGIPDPYAGRERMD
jgi:probable rRNA maturation factor